MLLVGDYVPKEKSVNLELPKDELILANLEAPIIEHEKLKAVPKSGPHLRNDSLGTLEYRFAFNLANNHMMDYGATGLEMTRRALREREIQFCGAGKNIGEARAPMILDERGKKIGVIGCCERQFGCAELDTPGCAEKGLWLIDEIKTLKAKCDYVVVSCHAALEHVPVPSPRLREFYRLLIDCGADIVHGHHAHVPQGWEKYRDGYIFYGLGNFVVDPGCWHGRSHLWSIVADVNFTTSPISVKVTPYGVSADAGLISVQPLKGDELSYAESYCSVWNGALTNDQVHQGAWQACCCELYDTLYGAMLKSPRYAETRRLRKRNRLRYAYDGFYCLLSALTGVRQTNARLQRDGRTLLNFFWCDSHVEAISTALGVHSGATHDMRKKWVKDSFERFGLQELG